MLAVWNWRKFHRNSGAGHVGWGFVRWHQPGAAAHQPGTWNPCQTKNKLSSLSGVMARLGGIHHLGLLDHSVSEIIRAVEAVADSDTNRSMTFNFRANDSDNDKHHKLFAEFL